MTDRSAVAFRVMGSRATLLGATNSLESINTTEIDNGALCYVESENTHYSINKLDNTTPPNPPAVIKPAQGGPGRWTVATGGAQGMQGAQGARGLQGSQGTQGAGFQGAQGATGTQGNQGFQGTQGAGFQGAQGPQGSTGVQGSQGFQGTQGAGAQGAQGSTGVQGAQGSQGTQGAGAQGAQGATGTQGAQGSQGTQGAGAQGAQGGTGVQGSQGAQGATGAGTQGAQGGTGTQGSQGSQGATGSGAQGAQGSQGATGVQGSQGATGTQGSQGNQGSQGATGLQGSQGFQGARGLQGLQGLQGSQGNTGAQGTTGLQGAQGATGVQGSQGNTGLQGNQGNQGATGAGTQGNQGATGLQGSQGNQGATGAGTQGAQGATGVQGAQGFQGAIGAGTQGAQGATGVQGSQGFQGATGAGTQGSQGATGTQGFQGATGSGAQGAQGFQGATGLQGNQGSQGFQGARGLQGFQGFQGATGTQGSQGATGAQGLQGLTGAQGAQGATGVQGFQGATGAQGSQGFQGASAAAINPLTQVFYVDSANGGTATGSIAQPYASPTAAFTAHSTGNITLLIAPATYATALTLSGDRNITMIGLCEPGDQTVILGSVAVTFATTAGHTLTIQNIKCTTVTSSSAVQDYINLIDVVTTGTITGSGQAVTNSTLLLSSVNGGYRPTTMRTEAITQFYQVLATNAYINGALSSLSALTTQNTPQSTFNGCYFGGTPQSGPIVCTDCWFNAGILGANAGTFSYFYNCTVRASIGSATAANDKMYFFDCHVGVEPTGTDTLGVFQALEFRGCKFGPKTTGRMSVDANLDHLSLCSVSERSFWTDGRGTIALGGLTTLIYAALDMSEEHAQPMGDADLTLNVGNGATRVAMGVGIMTADRALTYSVANTRALQFLTLDCYDTNSHNLAVKVGSTTLATVPATGQSFPLRIRLQVTDDGATIVYVGTENL